MSSNSHKNPNRKRKASRSTMGSKKDYDDFDEYESNDGYHDIDIDEEYEDDWDEDLEENEDEDFDVYDF